MSDFFEGIFDLGAEGRGWRSGWAIFGAVLGLVVGGYLGWTGGGFVSAVTSAGTGALIGWAAFVLFRGLLRFIVIFAICAVVVIAWYWLTGRFS